MRKFLALAVTFFLVCSCSAQSGKKSTPEERQQWASTLHKLEADPTNEELLKDAAHAANRLTAVDDVTIAPCGTLAEFPNKWDKSWGIMVYLLAMSAYQVETGKSDIPGENLYATRSMIKFYTAVIAKDPKLKDKKFDALVKMEADGKLSDLLAKDHCSNG